MKGTSQVIMGATLVMVASLAIVLGLVLVLLAELYCSLLLRRRRLQNLALSTTVAESPAPGVATSPCSNPLQVHSTLTSFYAQGVLDAPRSLLFPAVSRLADKLESRPSPHQIGLTAASAQNFSFMSLAQHFQNESPPHGGYSYAGVCADGASVRNEHLVYISNPIYDEDTSRPNLVQAQTPFDTPDSSPSRLEAVNSSCDEEIEAAEPSPSSSSPRSLLLTPPLTPMEKLPAQACSVPLRDAGSLCTSASESRSNNGLSFTSTGTACTSPSW